MVLSAEKMKIGVYEGSSISKASEVRSFINHGQLNIFFCEPGFKPAGPLPYTSHLNSQGVCRSPAPLPRATIPRSLTSFIYSGSILAKPEVCILTFSNTGHSHRICTDVSFSAPHLLHEGVFALLTLCSMYWRLICPVRRPTNILQCFLSNLLMN